VSHAAPTPATSFSANRGVDSVCCDSWEDIVDDESDLTINPMSGESERHEKDGYFDPWAGAKPMLPSADCFCGDPWQHYIKPVPPPSCLPLPRAPDFLPAQDGDDNSLRTIAIMQELIDKQNHTIATLTAQIESTSFRFSAEVTHDDSENIANRVAALEINLKQLGASLGKAVQTSIDSRLPSASVGGESKEHGIDDACFYSMLRPHLQDCILPAIDSAVHQGTMMAVNSTNDLIRKYDKIVQRRFAEIQQAFRVGKASPPLVESCASLGDAMADCCVTSSADMSRGRHHDRCSIPQFLEMSRAVKERIPHIREPMQRPLSLRDATTRELVHLIHKERQEWGRVRNLGPYTIQQAVCLHLATRTEYTESRMIELEEVAKLEDSVVQRQTLSCSADFCEKGMFRPSAATGGEDCSLQRACLGVPQHVQSSTHMNTDTFEERFAEPEYPAVLR